MGLWKGTVTLKQLDKRDLVAVFVVASVAVCAAGATLVATAKGIGLQPDSAAYFVGAQRLAQHPGMFFGLGTHPSVGDLTQWPPFMSLVLASTEWTSIDLMTRVKVLQVLLAALNVCLIAAVVRRVGSWSAAAVAVVFVAVSAGFITELHGQFMSEGLFVAFALSAVLTFDLALSAENRLRAINLMVATAVFVVAASLTRIIGLALVGAFAVVVVLVGRRPLPKWVAIGTLAIASLPSLYWMFGNEAGTRATSLGYQSTFLKRTRTGMVTVDSWLVPRRLLVSAPTQTVVTAAAIAVSAAGVWWFVRWARSAFRSELTPADRLTVTLVAVGCAYGAFLLWATLLVDPLVPFAPRTMLPMLILIVMVAAIRNSERLGTPGGFPRWVWAIGTVWVLVLGGQTAADVVDEFTHGSGYRNSEWTDSAAMKWIQTVPDDVTVVSNSPGGIYMLTGHRVGRLPDPTLETFNSEALSLGASVNDGSEVIVVFDNAQRVYFPDAEQVTTASGVTLKRKGNAAVSADTAG